MHTSLRCQGMSLLELLIALLVLSVGLLGVAAMQSVSVKNSLSTQQRVQAQTLASAMAERIYANSKLAKTGVYQLTKTCDVPSAGADVVSHEHASWLAEIKQALGRDGDSSSCGAIVFDANTRRYQVAVYWDDSRGLAGVDQMQFQVQVAL